MKDAIEVQVAIISPSEVDDLNVYTCIDNFNFRTTFLAH